MMSVLRLLTIPYIQQNPLRTALTVLGVAFGVAIFVAIRVTNLSTLRAFAETVDAVSGRTQLQVVGEVLRQPLGRHEDVLRVAHRCHSPSQDFPF